MLNNAWICVKIERICWHLCHSTFCVCFGILYSGKIPWLKDTQRGSHHVGYTRTIPPKWNTVSLSLSGIFFLCIQWHWALAVTRHMKQTFYRFYGIYGRHNRVVWHSVTDYMHNSRRLTIITEAPKLLKPPLKHVQSWPYITHPGFLNCILYHLGGISLCNLVSFSCDIHSRSNICDMTVNVSYLYIP